MLPALVAREPGNAGRDEGEEREKTVRSLGLGFRMKHWDMEIYPSEFPWNCNASLVPCHKWHSPS